MGNRRSVIILDVAILIYAMIYQMFIINNLLKYSDLISAAFMLIILSIAISVIGFRRDTKTKLKMDIFYKTAILVVLFFAVTYALGFLVGFASNAYSRSPMMILNNIFAPIFIIVCVEIYRYIAINSINCNSRIIVVTTAVLTIFEILITIKVSKLFAIVSAFEIITTKVLPIISKNIVMTSLCRQGGLRSTLLYRLVMDTYIYLVPIVPDFSYYLISVLGICFPIVLYVYVLGDINKEKGRMVLKSFKEDVSVVEAIIMTCIICLAMLLSGLFPLVIIGVGSNSMNPQISKGDAVIYKKVKTDKDLSIGEPIVFKSRGRIIVHRLIEKKKEGKTIYYITKGDANNAPDSTKITIDDIKGVVTVKIKYIAYPSVYFNEYMTRKGR